MQSLEARERAINLFIIFKTKTTLLILRTDLFMQSQDLHESMTVFVLNQDTIVELCLRRTTTTTILDEISK